MGLQRLLLQVPELLFYESYSGIHIIGVVLHRESAVERSWKEDPNLHEFAQFLADDAVLSFF